MKGVTGKYLSVDLSTGSHEQCAFLDRDIDRYIGGRSLGTKLFWDMQPQGVSPFSPENSVVIATGPVTGTLVPGGAKYVVITKSPATMGFLETYSSGRISYHIKGAGYDSIVLTGACHEPSYLFIDDNKVELRSAHDLWGKGAIEAELMLREMYGSGFGTMCIGIAGERLVPMAGITSDLYRQAARGGAGAVFGSKNLKAIVIRGRSQGISCANIDEVMRLQREHRIKMASNPVGIARMKYGTPWTLGGTNKIGMLPTKNFSTGHFENAEALFGHLALERLTIGNRSCIGCIEACSKITKIKTEDGQDLFMEGPEYETLALFGSNLGITDIRSIIVSNEICDRLGIDTISAANTIGFVMECFERGFLDTSKTGGISIKFGDSVATHRILEMMGKCEGFGAVMSKGCRYVAQIVGHDSQKFAMQIKGLEIPAYEPRASFGGALSMAVSPRGACHRRCWPHAQPLMEGNPYSPVGKASIVKKVWDETAIFHTLMFCDFQIKHAKLTMLDVYRYLEALTGEKFDDDKLDACVQRTETLIRLFNNREGFSRKDDTLPDRCTAEKIPDGPNKGVLVSKKDLDLMLDEYYSLRGWDKQGIPLAETIERLEVF